METRDTLLLVNDTHDSRVALQTAFEKTYNLLEAENGEQALLLMEENRRCIAAVILDTLMPIKNGYEVLTEMVQKGLLAELPVIVITDENNSESERKLFDLGASDVIYTPFDPYVVQHRTQNIIDLNRKRWQLEEVLEKQSQIPQHTNEAVVDALTSIIEYRSPESGLHIPRIRQFTRILLEEVARSCPEYNLTPHAITLIASASTFHDVGKISISDAILNKPERLTAEEIAIIQTHSLAGCRILQGMNQISDPEYLHYAQNICHYHHERWDGGGYPEGLKGDDIPVCAQVVGLVDVYDALTSEQVYKPSYPHGLAMNMILNGDCGIFSPKLLECLKQVSDRFSEIKQSYEDTVSPASDKPVSPIPAPASHQGFDTLQSVQMKYHALLYHLDATVMEVDLDNDFYHLVYNTNPCFSYLASEPSLTNGIQALFRQIAVPEELDETSSRFSAHIRAFIDKGLRKQSHRYALHNSLLDQRQWYEFTFLRIEPSDSSRHRLMVICMPSAPESIHQTQPEQFAPPQEGIYSLLAGVYCCHNDLWLSLEGDCEPLANLLGYTTAELKSQFQNRLINLVLPEDRQMIRRRIADQLSQGRNIELEYRLLSKDGQVVWVLNKGHLDTRSHGMECLYCILVDITQTKQTLDRLQQSLDRHQIIMAQSDDIVFEWDMIADTVVCTNKWQAQFGYNPLSSEFSSRISSYSHFHPDDLPAFTERMRELKHGSDYQEIELRIAKSDGRYLWCRIRATAQYGADGKPFRAVGVIINIDAEKRASLALKSKAERDSLTKLLNKNASHQQVEDRLTNRLPEEQSALLIIDLDNFKRVNDYHGHLLGDAVLTQAAAEIQRFFRSEDIIARIGGDEFMIYMSNVPNTDLVAHRCTSLIKSFRNLFADQLPDCALSCSIGVAFSPDHGVVYQDLFQRADLALYRAKAQGKNQYAFYDTTDHSFLPKAKAAPAASTAIDSNSTGTPSEASLLHYTFQQLYGSNDLESTIASILELTGQQVNASRVYIVENSADNKTCSATFEWCNSGIPSLKHNIQNISCETGLPEYEQNFDASGVFCCSNLTALPKEQYPHLSARDCKSTLQFAIRDNGIFRGYVGFDDCAMNRIWPQPQIDMLSSVSQILSVFLMKKRAQDSLNN